MLAFLAVHECLSLSRFVVVVSAVILMVALLTGKVVIGTRPKATPFPLACVRSVAEKRSGGLSSLSIILSIFPSVYLVCLSVPAH